MNSKRATSLTFLSLLVSSFLVPSLADEGTTAWVGNIGSDSISIIDVSDIDDDDVVDEVLFTVKPMCCNPGTICNPQQPNTPCINGPHDITFSPDGNYAYITAYDGDRLAVLDASTLRSVPPTAPIYLSRTNTGSRPQGIVASPDGYRVYVANSSSDNVEAFDVANGFAVSVTTVAVERDPNGIAIRPGGAEVWVTNNLGDSVSIIDPTNLTVTHTIENVGNAPRRVIFGEIPDGQSTVLRAFTVNAYGDSFTVIDPEADPPEVLEEVFVDDDQEDQTSLPRGIALHPDQEGSPKLYVTEYDSLQISVFESNDDYDLLDEVDLESPFGSPHRIAITPDGTKAYIANPDDDQVIMLNVETATMFEDPIAVQNGPGGTAILVQVPE